MFRWQFGLLDLKGLALIWIFICMVCWTGFEEILMGKLALSLVSLNQSQGTGLYIEMVCTMGGIMETGTVRRFICHSVIERLTRTLTLIFCVHDQQNSRSGGCWDGLYEWRRKERSWFSIIVSIVDDLSGGIGLYVIIMMEFWWYIENMYIFIVCNSIILCKLLAGYNIEIVLLLRLCLGIRINLEWRSCEVTVPISAKIGLVFIILIEARAQFLLLLLVLLVSVSFVKEKSGRYEKNVRSKLCWSSREWILELGVNPRKSLQHVPLLEYKQNLRLIVSFLKNRWPRTVIILITPPPIDEEARLRDGLHLSRVGNKVVFEEVTNTLKGEGIGAEDLVVDLPLIEDVDPKKPLTAFDDQDQNAVVTSSGPKISPILGLKETKPTPAAHSCRLSPMAPKTEDKNRAASDDTCARSKVDYSKVLPSIHEVIRA
ncbi:hypothetical protein YC2023_046552 [Brassica napus]